ncbi:MAG: aminotransferase class I/II-fold pyridoxal phosphate-dependent enzyme [Gorillibacterium sp.]|nr:aminotransferase class I/II-fold pyridoxal phosphate-dependent enzyme [Gorillibacterium sp.]
MDKSLVKSRIFLSPPHMSGKEQQYINDAFKTNWIAPLGPNVDAFEQEMAAYLGVNEAVALSSGTAALHLALRILDVQAGDRVFCSSLTFVASANPILYQGAEPVFIDSEAGTWNMSPLALERALHDELRKGRLPKAVIAVNLYGQSANMDAIAALCELYQVPLVEDAAESLGSSYKGKKSGTFGRLGIYSFNGNKIITTSGGGMLIADEPGAIAQARFLATQARDVAPHYQHSTMGYNYRLSNILAGVGRAQLEVLDDRVAARRRIFHRYEQMLGSLPGFTMMPEAEGTMSNRWLTTLTIDKNEAGVSVNEVLQALAAENIEARPVWKPLHLQPLFRNSIYYPHEAKENVSEQLFATGLCLPSGSALTEEEQMRVVTSIRELVEYANRTGQQLKSIS